MGPAAGRDAVPAPVRFQARLGHDGDKTEPAHAELVEARTKVRACLDKLGMSGLGISIKLQSH